MQNGIAGKARRTPGSEEQRHEIRIMLATTMILFDSNMYSVMCSVCMCVCMYKTAYAVGMYSEYKR